MQIISAKERTSDSQLKHARNANLAKKLMAAGKEIAVRMGQKDPGAEMENPAQKTHRQNTRIRNTEILACASI